MDNDFHQIHHGAYKLKGLKYGVSIALVLSMIFFLMHCGSTRDMDYSHLPLPADYIGNGYYQTPSGKYAAEVLSYMLQVVVGTAGDPATRQAWRTTSLTAALDLDEVTHIMQDPERRVSELMVYDANILGLSKVLYHYNQRLNYFKGRAFQESLYPSEELLAIRLFMVQKIAKGEKVRLGNLMALPTLFTNPFTKPSPVALDMANLSTEELRLLRDVIQSEPFFKDYLEDPFLVEALHRVGVVEMDAYVRSKIGAADYGSLAAEHPKEVEQDNGVRVAILPSMTKSFGFQAKGTPGFPLGFRANDDYALAQESLKDKLRAALQQRVLKNMEGAGDTLLSLEEKNRKAADIVNAHLRFYGLDKRPLVIYPENAEKIIKALCPDADFNFIILGKNVYLSMYIDEKRDTFPSVNRMYFDIMDIGRSQSDYEIDQVGEYLFNSLKAQRVF